MKRLCLLLLLALPAFGQPARELADETAAGLAPLRALTEAKDYAQARALLESLLPAAPAQSYDRYVLNQILAQVLLTEGRLLDAIPPLENARDLASFADPATARDTLSLLAQLYYQRAAELKDIAAQSAGYREAVAAFEAWLALGPVLTADHRLFHASLLYQLGTLDPEKPDPALLRRAQAEAREGLLATLTPSAQLRLLLVATHLQLGENAAAADQLELLAARDPRSATAWSQLQALHLAAAADLTDPAEARRQNLRALHVLERAQAAGHLNSPRDHYTRIAILFNLQQYAAAAKGLESGLTDGTLEDTKRNWELLASAYQQLNQEKSALDALTRAVARFPTDAALEFSLAQFLAQADQNAAAYTRAESALAKGLAEPGPAQVWLAFLAYEQRRFPQARTWLEAARASGQPPASLAALDAAITEALAR